MQFYRLKDYLSPASSDICDALTRCFSDAAQGGTVIIDPGHYIVKDQVCLYSNMTVLAEGAYFAFPETLPKAHVCMFYGEDIHNFTWEGGTFTGSVYNPNAEENVWPPHAETVAIRILGGSNLRFKQIQGINLAGSCVAVFGTPQTPIVHVALEDLKLHNCGKFMWDYGYLWQRITFPEYHTPCEVENAYQNMPTDYYSDLLQFQGDLITSLRLPLRQTQDDAVTFFGDSLPPEIVKGKYYYAEETEEGLHIRERLCDPYITFTPGNYNARMFRGIYQVYHAMYAPFGSGEGKGAVDIRYAKRVYMTGCTISAPGDATHFHQCSHGEIKNNMLRGARMGAMFLSSYCSDMTVSHNIVNGGNGSRVLTVETGGTNIRIISNIFYNGGRGTWIDTPHGILLKGNIFRQNTCKSTPDPTIGRLSPTQGTFERFAEIYFTTRQHGAVYGDIDLQSNVICTGEGCTAALAFNAHGQNIRISNNLFDGPCRKIYVSQSCENLQLEDTNQGNPIISSQIENESFDIPGTIYLPDGQRR